MKVLRAQLMPTSGAARLNLLGKFSLSEKNPVASKNQLECIFFAVTMSEVEGTSKYSITSDNIAV